MIYLIFFFVNKKKKKGKKLNICMEIKFIWFYFIGLDKYFIFAVFFSLKYFRNLLIIDLFCERSFGLGLVIFFKVLLSGGIVLFGFFVFNLR